MHKAQSAYSLFNNSRFYILVSSFLLSLLVIGFMRVEILSDQLFYIRTQQIFGLLCLVYWYIALIISPVGIIVGKQRMKRIEFARRAIGVSAFYFAALHAGIALWGQLGGLSQLLYLPTLFQWSLLGGAAGLLILAIMAATSFDKIVKFMTYRKWKWLHRLVYLAWIFVVLHVWSVGTHLAYTPTQLIAFSMLVILAGLELYAVSRKMNEKYLHFNKSEIMALFISAWAVTVIIILMIPNVVQNYHSRHTDHTTSSYSEMRQ